MKAHYLLNAFSLQMVDVPCSVHFEEVDELPEGLISAIGHQDTANILGVPMNRINVHLSKGDVAYVAQLQGGRLPEGSTTLPDGFSFKFIKVTVGWSEEMKEYLRQSIINSAETFGLTATLDSFFAGL
jgi:hypothetical protein